MATSPNYGWLEPDNTDLVKNGALAIRTLGNAIDTTMATMTPKSLVDAKGDLIAATADNTPARLAVGNNGETLVADSSATTGLRYTAGNPIFNPVINSCFDIWQRGTSISLGASTSYTNGYTADRWQTSTSTNQATTVSRQATGDTTNLPNVQYAMRFQRNSGQTGTGAMGIYESFESTNSIPFVGKTITFSFYARAGANFSSASNALLGRVYSGTGTDQTVFAYTSLTSVISTTATLTTTWQRFTGTATVGATATELAVGFEFTPVGTAGTNDYFEVTGVQIDIGSVALPVRRNAATIQGELSACQRYFEIIGQDQTLTAPLGVGVYNSTTELFLTVWFKVKKRVTASLSLTVTGGVTNYIIGTGRNSTAVVADQLSAEAASIKVTTSAATAGSAAICFLNNSVNSSLAFSAEL